MCSNLHPPQKKLGGQRLRCGPRLWPRRSGLFGLLGLGARSQQGGGGIFLLVLDVYKPRKFCKSKNARRLSQNGLLRTLRGSGIRAGSGCGSTQVAIPPTQTAAVRVYDVDTGFSDDQLLSADLLSDLAAAGPSDVAMAKEFVLADGGTGAQVALRIEFGRCP
jgi:hypothetical protein